MSVPTIHDLMDGCIKYGASDIHIGVGSPPVFRVNTELVRAETDTLTRDDTYRMMQAITRDERKEEFDEVGSTDFSFEYSHDGREARFRVSVYKERGNTTIALRRIPNKILTLEEIGLPKAVPDILTRPRGLLLVTGPTGSGKTTTLASMVNHINQNSGAHIVTFEDPIEYYHTSEKALIHQRAIGEDVPNFPEALRRVLRQDPDVILVGEMRDLETIRAAVTAAETGHLVMGTLHTSGAANTVNRMIDVFPVGEQEHIRVQLASSLIAVLSQALCLRLDGRGVVAAHEFMVVTPAIQHMIRTNRPFQIDDSLKTGAKNHGMQLLDDHLYELAQSQIISASVAIGKSRDPKAMGDRVRHLL